MKNVTAKYLALPLTLVFFLSSWAQAVDLVWGEGNWGESDWNDALSSGPEPAPTPDEVKELVNDIVIPSGDGDSIPAETIGKIGEAVAAASSLAQSLATNIGDTGDDAVIDALGAIGSVVGINGDAARNSTTTGNTGGAASTGSSGKTAINSFSTLLLALDNKTNASEEAVELSMEQKQAVQEATVQAVASAVNILMALPEEGEARKAVLEDLGRIVSSSVNLGLALTGEQADFLLEVTDQTGDENADLDEQLESSVPIKPRNKALVSKQVLGETLGGAIAEAELDTFLQELAAAINPADVNVGGVSGEESLNEGFSEAVGDGSGAVNFNAATGIITFSFGGADTQTQSGPVQFSALGSPVINIPARVVSVNVVASGFPDGVGMRSDGSVVVTRNRMASIVVPASADPVNFFADLRASDFIASTASDGNVTIRDGSLFFSGSFDFLGVTAGGDAQPVTTVMLPQGKDESDLNYRFGIVYRNGSGQVIQPFIAEDNFLPSTRSLGIAVSIDRNSGVVTADGLRFRPSYFIEPMDQETSDYWMENRDSFNLAYRARDVNNDGIVDIEVISALGTQVAYGLGG